jgi:hypothetical protein
MTTSPLHMCAWHGRSGSRISYPFIQYAINIGCAGAACGVWIDSGAPLRGFSFIPRSPTVSHITQLTRLTPAAQHARNARMQYHID